MTIELKLSVNLIEEVTSQPVILLHMAMITSVSDNIVHFQNLVQRFSFI